MKPLFTLYKKTFNADEQENVNAVSAREVHAYLGVNKRFSNWVKNQINRGRFVEGRDFIKVTQKGGPEVMYQTTIEYYFTIDAIKHIGMMSGTDKGANIREYYIALEKELDHIKRELSKEDLAILTGPERTPEYNKIRRSSKDAHLALEAFWDSIGADPIFRGSCMNYMYRQILIDNKGRRYDANKAKDICGLPRDATNLRDQFDQRSIGYIDDILTASLIAIEREDPQSLFRMREIIVETAASYKVFWDSMHMNPFPRWVQVHVDNRQFLLEHEKEQLQLEHDNTLGEIEEG